MNEECGCAEATEHVYDFQHGELSDAECARIREHLTHCRECMDLYKEEKTIQDRLSKCACEQAPEELRVRVVAFFASYRTNRTI